MSLLIQDGTAIFILQRYYDCTVFGNNQLKLCRAFRSRPGAYRVIHLRAFRHRTARSSLLNAHIPAVVLIAAALAYSAFAQLSIGQRLDKNGSAVLYQKDCVAGERVQQSFLYHGSGTVRITCNDKEIWSKEYDG